MKTYYINIDGIKNLTKNLLAENWLVLNEAKDTSAFVNLKDSEDVMLNSGMIPSKISFKEYFFPKSETLFSFKRNGSSYELYDPKDPGRMTLVLGAKPCDAASLPVMSKVFNWDYKDEFFNKKVENTIVMGLECTFSDESCFCTSVGLSHKSYKGSDIFLHPVNDVFQLEIVTEKGQKFFDKYMANLELFDEIEAELAEKIVPEIKKNIDYPKVKKWLDENFESSFWDTAAETCVGCAQCAYVCPVCHCFDIVDENCSGDCGRRVRNWDACQFGLFTKHASGHNPRDNQDKRYRQRVNHKFKYYNDKFEEILCTGCGRCTRGCPSGIDIGEIIYKIEQQSN